MTACLEPTGATPVYCVAITDANTDSRDRGPLRASDEHWHFRGDPEDSAHERLVGGGPGDPLLPRTVGADQDEPLSGFGLCRSHTTGVTVGHDGLFLPNDSPRSVLGGCRVTI
jgi:hypothetical protein